MRSVKEEKQKNIQDAIQMVEFLYEWVENIVGNKENDRYKYSVQIIIPPVQRIGGYTVLALSICS